MMHAYNQDQANDEWNGDFGIPPSFLSPAPAMLRSRGSALPLLYL
jgi:hypothetical protein